jgi:hypothetical protein
LFATGDSLPCQEQVFFYATVSIGIRTLSGSITWIVFAATLIMISWLKWGQILSLLVASLLGIVLKLLLS